MGHKGAGFERPPSSIHKVSDPECARRASLSKKGPRDHRYTLLFGGGVSLLSSMPREKGGVPVPA